MFISTHGIIQSGKVGGISPTPTYDYLLRQVSNVNLLPAMDGVELFVYKNKLKAAFGWSPLAGFPASPDSNYVFDTTDEGKYGNWTQGADSLAHATHGQGHGTRLDGKMWHWGISGDGLSTGVWTYDDIIGWVQVSADWTLGIRITHLSFLHDDYLYTLGGQDNINIASPTSFNSIYRTLDGITWSYVGPTPETFMSASTMWEDDAGNLYVTGGGELSNTNYNSLCGTIYKSTDHGFNWAVFATLPAVMQGIWQDAFVWDKKVWFVNGFKSGANQPGLLMSENWGLTWTTFSTAMPARHLTAGAVANDHLHFVCGNLHKDHWRLEKITYPFAMDTDVKKWFEKIYPENRPDITHLTAVNNLVITLKSDLSLNGITSNWTELDLFHVLAGMNNKERISTPIKTSNALLKNGFRLLKNPIIYYNGIRGNGNPDPTLASGMGLNWIQHYDGIKFTDNFCSLFAYSMSTLKEDTNDFGNASNVLDFCQTNDTFYANINSISEGSMPAVDGKGYRGATRFDATNREIILNTTHVASTMGMVSNPSEWSICGVLGAGTDNFYGASGKTYSALGNGSGDLDHGKMKTAIEAYFTELGISF